MVLPVTVSASPWIFFLAEQLAHHRRHAAGAMEGLAEILAGRHAVHQQRDVVADPVPVGVVELDADVARDGVDVRRAVGRGAERARRHDGVLERLARQDVGRLQVLPHHVDDALAGLVGDLAALAVRAREWRRSRSATCRAPRPCCSSTAPCPWCCSGRRWARSRPPSRGTARRSMRARRQLLAGVPDDGARARQAAGEMAVEHRPARQHDRRNVDRGRAHDHGRRGLVAAGGQHDAVEEIAVQALDQAEIGEVAVERRGRPLAGLLDRMDRETRSGMPPASRMPSRTRSASSR